MKAINVVWQNYGRRRIYDDDDEEFFFEYNEKSNTSYIEAVDGKGNRKRVDIESSIFKEFWEEIKKIDFIKAVEENENYYGDDDNEETYCDVNINCYSYICFIHTIVENHRLSYHIISFLTVLYYGCIDNHC